MNPLVKSLAVTVWACMLVSGCARNPVPATPDLGGPTGTITWSPAGKDSTLPGIDQGNVYHLGKAFVVWADAGGGGGGSSSGDMRGVKCQGNLQGQDGRRIEFFCETKDGKTGQATINGAAYELAAGNLFLVSTQGKQSRVTLQDSIFAGETTKEGPERFEVRAGKSRSVRQE
jgi:hypothetical protein